MLLAIPASPATTTLVNPPAAGSRSGGRPPDSIPACENSE